MLKLITEGLTLASILTGGVAAVLWWWSTKVPISPRWPPSGASNDSLQIDQLEALARASSEAGRRNAHASYWTAASVAAQAAATVLGWIASG